MFQSHSGSPGTVHSLLGGGGVGECHRTVGSDRAFRRCHTLVGLGIGRYHKPTDTSRSDVAKVPKWHFRDDLCHKMPLIFFRRFNSMTGTLGFE